MVSEQLLYTKYLSSTLLFIFNYTADVLIIPTLLKKKMKLEEIDFSKVTSKK